MGNAKRRGMFSRRLVILIAIILIAGAAFYAYGLPPAAPANCSAVWMCASPYPVQAGGTFGIAGAQCALNSTRVYCVGGVDPDGGPRADVYYASTSPSGNLSLWSLSPNGYPLGISGDSCVLASAYLYCVGGIHDVSGDDQASTFYAPVATNGVGPWNATTPYPVPIDSESCAASGSYIYCVGGNNETSGSNSSVQPSGSAWFARLSSGGIGPWTRTTSYPSGVYVPSCLTDGGYIYCVGGADPSGNPVSKVYYAQVSGGGIGGWAQTTAYAIAATGQACAISGGRIYCVGGETSGGQLPAFTSATYSADVSAAGVGAWGEGPAYPRDVGTSCVATAAFVYCVGGFDDSSVGENQVVNYARLSSLGT